MPPRLLRPISRLRVQVVDRGAHPVGSIPGGPQETAVCWYLRFAITLDARDPQGAREDGLAPVRGLSVADDRVNFFK